MTPTAEDRSARIRTEVARPDGGVTRWLLAASGVVVAGWLVALVVWPDAPFALTFDDAYYYLGIARNIADGHGSTFDGLNPTNGYHPLWLAICVLAFKAGLDDLVVFVIGDDLFGDGNRSEDVVDFLDGRTGFSRLLRDFEKVHVDGRQDPRPPRFRGRPWG